MRRSRTLIIWCSDRDLEGAPIGGAPARFALAGFTMIELLVALAVFAILLAIAVPSFQVVTNINRLAGGANEIMAGLQLARVEAVRRNERVIFCRSDDGSTCNATVGTWGGWLVFADTNADDTPQADEILRTEAIAPRLEVQGSASINGVSNAIAFRSDGLARDSGGAALLTGRIGVCIPTVRPDDNARDVLIGSGGRLAVNSNSQAGLCPVPADAN